MASLTFISLSIFLLPRLSITVFIFLLPLDSLCLSVSLPPFLVPAPSVSLSLCLCGCVCLSSWCFKLPLLQSGCWDSGPELPALGPRPLHFLNLLPPVSWRRAGCRKNRKEVDPRGPGLWPHCPSCPWAGRDGSAENSLAPSTSGGGVLGSKLLILGHRCQHQ